MQTAKMPRAWALFAVGLTCLLLGFLVGPRVPEDQQAARCLVNVHLPGPFGISLNCDSPEFLRLASNPTGLLEPNNTRQTRPGLILAAAALSLPLKIFATLPDHFGAKARRPDIDPQRISNALQRDFPAYIAYVILNIALLCLTFYYFCRTLDQLGIIRVPSDSILVGLIGLLFVANDVTKAYFWSPHTQMFNIFVPVFATFVFSRAWQGSFRERWFAVSSGAITGLGLTAYPIFLILLPSLIFAGLTSLVRVSEAESRVRIITNMLLFTAASAAPALLWFAFVKTIVGEFYSHEIAQGPAIWIPEALSGGIAGVIAAVVPNIESFFWLAVSQASALAALFTVALVLCFLRPQNAALALRANASVLVAAVIVNATLTAYYSAAGTMHYRWAYSIIPPALIAVAALILSMARHSGKMERRLLIAVCVTIVMAHAAYAVLKDGPFS